MNFILTDGITVINLDLNYSTSKQAELIINQDRSFGGRESSFKWGLFNKWDLNINYIPSSDASTMNDWWRDSTSLTFMFDVSTYTVYLTGKTQPFQSFSKPYQNMLKGSISIEKI